MVLEVLEGLRGVGDRLLGHRWEGLADAAGQVGVHAVTHAGVADLVQQREVAGRVGAAEEPLGDLDAVVRGRGEDSVRAELGAQPVGRQRNLPLGERELDLRAARGGEPPGGDPVGVPPGADPASDGAVAALARDVGIGAAELDPQVAGALRLVCVGEHPGLEDAGLLTGGVDAAGVGLEQERQQHVHRRRLAGAVDAAQQQPAAREVQRLVLVLVDVEYPGARRLPTVRRHRHRVSPRRCSLIGQACHETPTTRPGNTRRAAELPDGAAAMATTTRWPEEWATPVRAGPDGARHL